MLVVGVIFVVITIAVPRGLVGIVEDLGQRLLALRPSLASENRNTAHREEVA
jgi:hypothetical protein